MRKGQNNKGLSLVELLVAGSIGCAVLLYTTQFIKINETSNKKIQNDLEDTSDNLNMEAILRKDLTNAKHSLNNLSVEDDSGKKFFDYLSSSTCSEDCTRSIKMEIGEKPGDFSKKSIYFIIINTAAGDQQIYNPADAYTRGTLKFNSLNYNNTLSVRPNSPWDVSIKTKGTLMFVYSPIEIFSPVSGIATPGRTLSCIGWAGSGNFLGKLIPETITDNGISYYVNSDLRNGKIISSEDAFFKNMPYTTGLGSFAFLTAVKVIRYRLKTVQEGGKLRGELLRAELNSNKVFDERPVGFSINKIEFRRETISSPAISIKTENVK